MVVFLFRMLLVLVKLIFQQCWQVNLTAEHLVIAPPVLLEKSNPGSWPNVFSDFRVPADFESLGKLDDLLNRGTDKYTNIIIDEAHRFRTETTITYEKLG